MKKVLIAALIAGQPDPQPEIPSRSSRDGGHGYHSGA